MKHMSQLHAQYMNLTYKRTGALWDGRYRSCVIQSDRYLLTCYRYIELNPLRAALVERPEDFFWSSYRTNALNAASELITPHEEYLRLGASDHERKRAYAALVASGLEDAALSDIRVAINSGRFLGDRGFGVLLQQHAAGLSRV